MKEERMLRVFGEVDEDLVADARHIDRGAVFRRWGTIAAAAILLAVGITLIPRSPQTEPPLTPDTSAAGDAQTEDSSYPSDPPLTTAGAANADATTGAGATTTAQINATKYIKPTATKYVKDPELALVPKWEDKTIKQKFPEIPFGDITYSVYYTIDPKDVGEPLGTTAVKGQDVYTDTIYTTTATLYRLADIAPHCAVAIRYEGVEGYYSAVQTWYQPETLGQFLTDLNLKKHSEFDEVHWDYFDKVYHYRTYTGLSKERVFDLLLDDTTLQNVYDDRQHFYDTIDIAVDLPILGLENKVVMSVSEDGYLFTNILGSGKTFYIGTERLEAFKDYLQKNCEYTVRTMATQTVVEPTEIQPPHTGTTTAKGAQPPRTSGAYIPE